MTTQILVRSGWTTVENARTIAFDFQAGTIVIDGIIEGVHKQIELPRSLVRRVH